MHLKISSSTWRPFCPEGDELNSLASWRYCNFKSVISVDLVIVVFEHFLCNWNATGLHSWQINIDSGKNLLPSNSQLLPGPMLTQFYEASRSLGASELQCISAGFASLQWPQNFIGQTIVGYITYLSPQGENHQSTRISYLLAMKPFYWGLLHLGY